ncbi:MAG: fibronectin type III domain-containing protein [Candidatus Krumholzibacteria bacterium]|nr:fibronectin type III domain-containing protein [Candidatus Krumholzibacteria bacterium]
MKRLTIALVLLLAACTSDLTLPPEIDGTVPPIPGNLLVTTSDHTTFDVSWTISDPTVIRHYRIYWTLGGPPTLQDTPTTLSAQLIFPVPVEGVAIGVTAVSTDNIEGQAAFDIAD